MPFSAPLIPENGLSSGSNQEEEAQAPPPRRHRKSVFVGANGNPYSNDLRDGGSGYNSSEDDVHVENGDVPKLPPLNDASPFIGTGLRRDLRELPIYPAFHWDNIDVCHWLLDKNLAALVDAFYNGQVVGSTLLQMTARDISKLGVVSVRHQQAVLALRDTLIANAPDNGWTFDAACSLWDKYRAVHVLGVAAETARQMIEHRLNVLEKTLLVALILGAVHSAAALFASCESGFSILSLLSLFAMLVSIACHFLGSYGGYKEQLDFFEAVNERARQLFKATVDAVGSRQPSIHDFSVVMRESIQEIDRLASSGHVGDFYEVAVNKKIIEEEALGGTFRSTFVDALPEKKGLRLLILNEASDGTLFRAFPDNPVATKRREKHQLEDERTKQPPSGLGAVLAGGAY